MKKPKNFHLILAVLIVALVSVALVIISLQNNAMICGNSQCETGETNNNCPQDCAPSDCNGYCKFQGFSRGICAESFNSSTGDWVLLYAPFFSDCSNTVTPGMACYCSDPQKCMGDMPSPYCEKHGGVIDGGWPGGEWCQCASKT